MAFTFVDSATAFEDAESTTLDCATTLDVLAGDLLVSLVSCRSTTNLSDLQVSDSDGTTNILTLTSAVASASHSQRMGYKIAASAKASSTMRMALGTGSTYVSITVLQFRPDAGDTVTLDGGPSSAIGASTAPASGTINTTGTDEVVVGGISKYQLRVLSNHLIAGSAVNGSDVTTYQSLGYTIFGSTQSNITTSATLASSGTWIADILAFKSTAAGISIPVIINHLRNQGVL